MEAKSWKDVAVVTMLFIFGVLTIGMRERACVRMCARERFLCPECGLCVFGKTTFGIDSFDYPFFNRSGTYLSPTL